MKILILKPGGVGDTIVLYPALVELRRKYVDAEIDAAGNCDALSLLARDRIISKAISFDSRIITELCGGEISDRGADFLKEYDECYFFIGDDGTVRKNLKRAGIKKYFIGTAVQRGRVIPQWIFLCELMDLSPRDPEVYVNEFMKHRQVGERNYISIHPGSGGRSKNWPIDNYIQLIGYLSDRHGAGLRVLLGYAEHDISSELEAELYGKIGIELIMNRSLGDVVDLLSASRLFIGNDSGIAHLAGLTVTPSVVLFGPTDPLIWKPLGDVEVITPDGSSRMEDIPLRRIIEEADRILRKDMRVYGMHE